MRITGLEIIGVGEPEPIEPTNWWCTTPMDVVVPRQQRVTRAGPGQATNVIVKVNTDEGLYGLGTVGLGSPAARPIIEQYLQPIVLGESPFNVELMWEKMFRSTLNIGRKGLVLEAMSAIDIALWDILGKATGQPVHNLLGGSTRAAIRAYASQCYAMEDLGRLRDEATGYKDQGFSALKMRFGYGPSDGPAGKRKNYNLVRTVREAIGPDVELMADAYMGWDVPYAIDMIHRVEEFDLKWVEEPVVPDDLDGYSRIRAAVRTPISGGEHEFTRWGYREMLQKQAVDILQPDVNRMGGITEARKVWSLASAFNVPVIPHSTQAHNAHLIMAHLNSPLIEAFPRGTIRASYNFYSELFTGEPEVIAGYVHLSDRPGLGIDLNKEILERYRVW
jgi:L-alanine-DL-glutamate epimerase-like enolase superfamily enzyme